MVKIFMIPILIAFIVNLLASCGEKQATKYHKCYDPIKVKGQIYCKEE